MKSSFLADAVDEVLNHLIHDSLDDPPSEDEVIEALMKMNCGKAGGKNGVLPELLKCCGECLLDQVVELFQTVWKEGSVPQEWKDALVVPIPKKGDLSQCDNCRGISLLDVGGKLFSKIIQQRLLTVAEKVLFDSQCGFRAGRGCIDMIFCARLLVEKAIEHCTRLYLLFIDLRKAYDSVPREAMWCVLKKYGIPSTMRSVICSFHDGMRAEVTVDGQTAPEFEVCNGFRQGCVIAPTLFILYFALVMEQWRVKCGEFGVDVWYKYGGKLVGDRTRRPLTGKITELLFTDYRYLNSSTDSISPPCYSNGLNSSSLLSPRTATNFALARLSVSPQPFTSLSNSLAARTIPSLSVPVATASSAIDRRGSVMKEVGERITRVSRAFGIIKHSILKPSNLSLESCVQSSCPWILLYRSEA